MMFFRSKNKIQRKTLPEKNEQEAGFKMARALFYFLATVFLAVSTYVILFSPFLEINNVQIQGTHELSYEKVKQSVNSFLSEKHYQILPKNNLIIASESALQSRLENDFKKISTVEIKKVFPNALIISITERKALLIWCSGDRCFLADEKGIAYAPADFASPEVKENNLIVIHDQSQTEVTSERSVLNPAFANFLVEFRTKAEDILELNIDYNFDTPQAISGDFTALTDEGWKIDLNAALGEEKEIAMLRIVLDQNIDKDKRKELEYVDLRTEGKVYYKFKDAVSEKPAENSK